MNTNLYAPELEKDNTNYYRVLQSSDLSFKFDTSTAVSTATAA